MNVDPRQNDPEFQDPNAADAERQSQFGMQSRADMPLAGGATGAGTTSAPVWGQRDVLASAPVYGSDDKKIGTVQESYNDAFKVRSGILMLAHDYYFPYTAIAHSDPERIVLNLTSDEAKHENWRQPPPSVTAPTSARPPEYGVYGPEGPEDTMQAATERGTETAIPMGPASTTGPTQGDMAYRGTMGPNNEPGLADRPYNPGLQGTGEPENAAGTIPPEEDPTSWNPNWNPDQRPNSGA